MAKIEEFVRIVEECLDCYVDAEWEPSEILGPLKAALPGLRLLGLVPGLEGVTISSTALLRSRDGLVRFINLDPGVRNVDVSIEGGGFEWRERVPPNASPTIFRRYVFRGVNDLGVREFEEEVTQ